MKSKKLFVFLSVLLCSSMIFSAGCSSKKGTLPVETGNKAGESLSYYVDAKFESDYLEYLSADKIDGEYVCGFEDGLVVFKNKEKDFMNNITETYSVYNVSLDNTVLTFENKYEDLHLGNVDKFENEYLQPSVKTVSIEKEGDVSYIKITTRTNTKIDESLIEDYEDHNYEGINGVDRYKGNGYASSYTYDYYDATGKLITSSKLPVDVEYVGNANGVTKVDFGKISAVFDNESSKVIKTWDSSEESKRVLYDRTNDIYGYYLEAPYGTYGAMEVYDLESNELVYRFVYSVPTQSYVLANGEVLIQTMNAKLIGTDIDDPNSIDLNVETYIFNPDAVSIKKVETDYIFQDVVTGEELAKNENNIYTNKVLNMGIVCKKSEAVSIFEEPETKVVFFNSDLEITCEVVALHPEQVAFDEIDDWEASIKRLASGDYLVSIKSAVANVGSAIIRTDGTLRTYVPYGATVLEKAIVTSAGIYDFDFKLIKKFKPGDSFYGNVGTSIVVRRYESSGDFNYTYHVITESDYLREYNGSNKDDDDKYLSLSGNTFEGIRILENGFYIGVNAYKENGVYKYEYGLYNYDERLVVDDCDYYGRLIRFDDNYVFESSGNIYKIVDTSGN